MSTTTRVSDKGAGEPSSDAITLTGDGDSENGITGSESFRLKFNEEIKINRLEYYCTTHSNMNGNFKVSE